MFVPASQVFCFNLIKRPVVSALWYAVLVHFIFEPFSTAAIIISSLLLAVSCFSIRYYLAIFSPVPMIISIILCASHYPGALPYICFFAAVWLILYIIAMVVTIRTAKNEYYIDPSTGIMYKR